MGRSGQRHLTAAGKSMARDEHVFFWSGCNVPIVFEIFKKRGLVCKGVWHSIAITTKINGKAFHIIT